jgi:hypothetical protein
MSACYKAIVAATVVLTRAASSGKPMPYPTAVRRLTRSLQSVAYSAPISRERYNRLCRILRYPWQHRLFEFQIE